MSTAPPAAFGLVGQLFQQLIPLWLVDLLEMGPPFSHAAAIFAALLAQQQEVVAGAEAGMGEAEIDAAAVPALQAKLQLPDFLADVADAAGNRGLAGLLDDGPLGAIMHLHQIGSAVELPEMLLQPRPEQGG